LLFSIVTSVRAQSSASLFSSAGSIPHDVLSIRSHGTWRRYQYDVTSFWARSRASVLLPARKPSIAITKPFCFMSGRSGVLSPLVLRVRCLHKAAVQNPEMMCRSTQYREQRSRLSRQACHNHGHRNAVVSVALAGRAIQSFFANDLMRRKSLTATPILRSSLPWSRCGRTPNRIRQRLDYCFPLCV